MKNLGTGTEQLSLFCNWQHKVPTGLTFSFSSISASDSSNQRSKSGARKSGRFSCLVSLSHQLLSFFCTVMFSCLWVILHTGWGQTHQQMCEETSSETELIPKLPLSRRRDDTTAAAQTSLCHPRHRSKRQSTRKWQL